MNDIGRPYSPTDLSSPLISWLGHKVTTKDGVTGTLSNVTEDGLATIVDDTDVVIALVPTADVI
jgi:hypothetical protein